MGDNEKNTGRVFLTTSRVVGLVGVALFLAVLVLFVADNFVLIQVRLLNIRVQIRLAWALLSAFLAGGALGFLIGRVRR